jgi:hypothetical protein
MKPKSPRKQPKRPVIRNRNGQRRTKKIEIKLTPEELQKIRKIYGRLAAAVARDYWLGFEPKDVKTPSKKAMLAVARAMHGYRLEMEKLRQLVKSSCGQAADEILNAEEQKFNELARTCFSNFSHQ